MLDTESFNRYEYKYLLDKGLYIKIYEELKARVKIDLFGNNEGFYTISSIYFDNKDLLFCNETINKQNFRQKLRLRAYNECRSSDSVFFEIKMKYNGYVRKRRTNINLDTAEAFINESIHRSKEQMNIYVSSNNQILKEIKFMLSFYNLEPKVVVSYDRQAFTSLDDDCLRITFDMNIRSRDYDFNLANGSHGTFVSDTDCVIMEVKTDKNLPSWLTGVINKYGCKNISFSKYCSHYFKGEIQNVYGADEGSLFKAGSY